VMTRDGFTRQPDITYLDRKHKEKNWHLHKNLAIFVTTLALGSQPRQGLARVWAKREAQKSHCMLPGVYESVREWTLTLPSELPL
jgi:hypothetical protein